MANRMGERISEQREVIERGLEPGGGVPELLRAFRAIGLRQSQLSAAMKLSSEALRKWGQGGSVRASNSAALGQLRTVVVALIGSLEPAEVTAWLIKAPIPGAQAPLYLVREHPEAVLSAARARVTGDTDLEVRTLVEASGLELPSGSVSNLAPPGQNLLERSSTQLRKDFFGTLLKLSTGPTSPDDVMAEIEKTYQAEMDGLANYDSYHKLVRELRSRLEANPNATTDEIIEEFVSEKQQAEAQYAAFFANVARRERLVEHGARLMVYALSMRVIQALRSVDREIQRSSTLLIGECRVRSAPPLGRLIPFSDAAQILGLLEKTEFEKYVILDGAATSLMRLGGEVTQLILGAQRVYEDPESGRYTHFIATAGTQDLLTAAYQEGIPVDVLFERYKVVEGKPDLSPEDSARLARRREESIVLPPCRTSPGGRRATLLAVSEELCEVDPEFVRLREAPDSTAEADGPAPGPVSTGSTP